MLKLQQTIFDSQPRLKTWANWRLWSVFLAVVVLAVIVFFGRLGDFPLFNPDEGLYAEPAREMLETGEYLTTLLNYVVRYTKPPLVIWAMAASYQIFGVSEFAARFFGAFCALALVLCTFFFAKHHFGLRCAFFVSLVLITSPLFIGVGREAITDMPLAFFVGLGIMAFYTAFEEQDSRLKWLGYISIGLAAMTKGPVGVILPLITLFVFYLYTGRLREAYRFFQLPLGAVIVLAIALPWFVAEIIATKGAYFREFILHENFERFTSVVDSHKGAWWYHLAAVAGGFFPWSVFLPQALFNMFKNGVFRKTRTDQIDDLTKSDRLLLFASCWALITIVFFSVSVSKLLPYTVPAFPALALIVAWQLDQAVRSRLRLSLGMPYVLLTLVYCAALAAGSLIVSHLRDAPIGFGQLIEHFGIYQVIVLITAIFLVVLNFKLPSIVLLQLSLVCGICYFGSSALNLLAQTWEGDLPKFGRLVALAKEPVIVYGLRKPGIPFYTHRKVISVSDASELSTILEGTASAYIITKTKKLSEFANWSHCEVLGDDHRYVLVLWQKACDVSKSYPPVCLPSK